jgi:hypothetical protein
MTTTTTENLLRSYLQLRLALHGAEASLKDGLDHGFHLTQRKNIREVDLPIINKALADSDQALDDAGLFPVE